MIRLVSLATALGALAVTAGPAGAEPIAGPLPVGQTIAVDTTPAPLARPRSALHPLLVQAGVTPSNSQVNSDIIYLNRCTGGCNVRAGATDSRNDTSDIVPNGADTLSEFSGGDALWSSVVTCMQQVYEPFQVKVTDVDPGSAPHFEVMIAGTSEELGEPADVGGVADFACTGKPGACSNNYLPNALVFDFANEAFYGNNAIEICATAAQEIAHSFTLDHVIAPDDPMTYNQSYQSIRIYHDGEVCGSDCVSGKSPFGLTCTGAGAQTHTCMGSGAATQDENKTILALFGSSSTPPSSPTVAFVTPIANDSVQTGFPINVTPTDAIGVSSVQVAIDGTSLGTDTMSPYVFNASTTIAPGTHHVTATATNIFGLTGAASIDVTVEPKCTTSADCLLASDVCVATKCEPGPTVTGGLGTVCTASSACASQQCGNDGTGDMYCVDACAPATPDQCPDSFTCLSSGASGTGVCWPGDSSGGGGGGCAAGGSAGSDVPAPLWMTTALGVLWLARRRRS